MNEQTEDMTAPDLCTAALKSGDPAGYLRRFLDRRSKELLLAKYAEMPVSRFWQIDAWANIRAGQMPTEPDSEGDWIAGGEVVDLMRSRPNVRLMISLDEPPTQETVIRLLRKIINEWDGLTSGLSAGESEHNLF